MYLCMQVRAIDNLIILSHAMLELERKGGILLK